MFFGYVKYKEMILNDIGKIVNNFWQEIPKHFPFVLLDSHIVMPNHLHGILAIDKPWNDPPPSRRDEAPPRLNHGIPIEPNLINNQQSNNLPRLSHGNPDNHNIIITPNSNNIPHLNHGNPIEHDFSMIQHSSDIPRRDEAMPRLYNHEYDNTANQNQSNKYTGDHPEMSQISPQPGSSSVIIGSFKSACTKMIRKKFPEINFAWQERFYDRVIRNEFELQRIRKYINTNPEKWHNDRNNPEGLYM